MAFPITRWFKPSEFKHPELMDSEFILWLDLIRDRSNVSMFITDDARLPGDRPSGSSKTSLHFRGRAVDIRSKNWTAEEKWRLSDMIHLYAAWAPGKVEFELVYDAKTGGDKHWHIGVDDKALQHQFIESDD